MQLKDFVPVRPADFLADLSDGVPGLAAGSFPRCVRLPRKKGRRRAGCSMPQPAPGRRPTSSWRRSRSARGSTSYHVPFKGSPAAMASVQSGDTPIGFETATAATPQAQAGKVRVLATTAATRTSQFPDAPTLVEAGLPNFVFMPWAAVVAPAGTPAPIVEKVNAAVNRILQDKEMQTFAASIASFTRAGTPQELQAFMRNELALWGEAVRTSGAKLD